VLPYYLGIAPKEDALSVQVDRNAKFIVNSNGKEIPNADDLKIPPRWNSFQFKYPLLGHGDTILVKVQDRNGAWVKRGVTADEFIFNTQGELKFEDHLSTPFQRAKFLADFIPCFPKYQDSTHVRKILSQGLEGFLAVRDLCK